MAPKKAIGKRVATSGSGSSRPAKKSSVSGRESTSVERRAAPKRKAPPPPSPQTEPDDVSENDKDDDSLEFELDVGGVPCFQTGTPNVPCLIWNSPWRQTRDVAVQGMSVRPTRFVDQPTCVDMGHWEDIELITSEIGWPNLVRWNVPSYSELVKEFVTTLRYVKFPSTPDKIDFRLCGREFVLGAAEVTQALGIVFGPCVPLSDLNTIDMWRAISGLDDFRQNSEASKVTSMPLAYLHKVLSSSIFGRQEETNQVNKKELVVLYSATKHRRAPWEEIIMDLFKQLAKKKKGILSCGALVTQLAISLHMWQIGANPAIQPVPGWNTQAGFVNAKAFPRITKYIKEQGQRHGAATLPPNAQSAVPRRAREHVHCHIIHRHLTWSNDRLNGASLEYDGKYWPPAGGPSTLESRLCSSICPGPERGADLEAHSGGEVHSGTSSTSSGYGGHFWSPRFGLSWSGPPESW